MMKRHLNPSASEPSKGWYLIIYPQYDHPKGVRMVFIPNIDKEEVRVFFPHMNKKVAFKFRFSDLKFRVMIR